MMAARLEPGVCPKCKEYLLVKTGVPFLVCPLCHETISNHEAVTLLEQKCADPKAVDTLVADCIWLEARYGVELPYMILANIADNFPNLESPAYLLTKMLGYSVAAVRHYLKNFSGIKSQPANVPWAEEFLDNCLDYSNMEYADLFLAYIDNKIRPEKQAEYRDKVYKLRKEYTFKAENPDSTKWIMFLYIASAVINVLLFPCFMLISGWLSRYTWMFFALNIALAMVAVFVENLLLYVHHRIYGNRLNMSEKERLCMVIFMSSMMFVIGAAIMGSIWQIRF